MDGAKLRSWDYSWWQRMNFFLGGRLLIDFSSFTLLPQSFQRSINSLRDKTNDKKSPGYFSLNPRYPSLSFFIVNSQNPSFPSMFSPFFLSRTLSSYYGTAGFPLFSSNPSFPCYYGTASPLPYFLLSILEIPPFLLITLSPLRLDHPLHRHQHQRRQRASTHSLKTFTSIGAGSRGWWINRQGMNLDVDA